MFGRRDDNFKDAVRQIFGETIFAAHMADCKDEKREIKEMISELKTTSDQRHEQNLARFGKIENRMALWSGAILASMVVLKLVEAWLESGHHLP